MKPGKFDVAHRRLGGGVPKFAAHRAAGECLESRWGYELARAGRHDDLHFGAPLSQAAHEVRTFIGCDAAGDPEQNPFAFHTPIIGLFGNAHMI